MKASSIREKLVWFANSGLPILLAVVVMISAAYFFRPRFVWPPVLLVDGVTYLAPQPPHPGAPGESHLSGRGLRHSSS